MGGRCCGLASYRGSGAAKHLWGHGIAGAGRAGRGQPRMWVGWFGGRVVDAGQGRRDGCAIGGGSVWRAVWAAGGTGGGLCGGGGKLG